MDCVDYLQALHELREKIRRYDMLKAQYEGALDTLNRARKRQPRATADFDIAKKEAYIHKKIGPEPEKPKGIMKLAIPVYRKKMKAYEEAYADYRARYAEGERSYYNEYADQRSKLEEEEKKEIESNIHQAEIYYEGVKQRFLSAEKERDEDDLLSTRLKKLDAVDRIIGYFEDKRVDTLKEAVNLFYEDEHRDKLEEFAHKQLQLTEEAKEYARQAAISSSEAASSAQEAVDRAESALSRANEAYSKAEEAYDQAQSAYWAASSNS